MAKKRIDEKLSLDSDILKRIPKAVDLFINKELNSTETRYNSWTNCHSFFLKLKKHNSGKSFSSLEEVDKQLSLFNLSYYLASWGMYRGSSFILQYDNSIFENVITIILADKYDILWDIDYATLKANKDKVKNLLVEIKDEINNVLIKYKNFYHNKNKLSITDKNDVLVSKTLITKILLGTICCCPAYDTYFVDAIGGTFNDFYNQDKIDNLLELIIRNDIFNELSIKTKYPLMKIVDMAYFNIGIEKKFKNYYNNYISKMEIPTSNETWKNLVKSIKQFYYKLNDTLDFKVHASFDFDQNKIDEYINLYKDKITKKLQSLKKETNDD